MAGFIRRRGKASWEITVDLGRDESGRRKRRFFTVNGTRKDAERARSAALHERDTGVDVDPGRITVAEYLARWLRDYAQTAVTPSTLERYQEMIEHQLAPSLGHLLLRDLRPAHIQAAYAKFTRRDGKAGQLSSRTIAHTHALLREALRRAVQWQLIARNPSDAVAPPKAMRQEMRVLNEDDVACLLEAAKATRTTR
jgi:integrase